MFILVLLYLRFVYAQTGGCTYSYNGDDYDLSSLSNSGSDYKIQMTPASTISLVNVCRPVVSTLCKACCGSDVAGCQQWDPSSQNGQASMGAYSSATFMTLQHGTSGAKGVTLQYVSGLNARTYEIDFICDSGAGTGSPIFENENPTKHYNFQWTTSAACPTNSNSSGGIDGGGIFLIILLCVTIVYCAGGVVFNKFYRKQETTIELVPQWGFWSSIPGLTKDGVMFLVNKVRGKSAGTYERM